MATTIQCPECDASTKVADDVLGKKVRCKSCKAVFRAESPNVEVAENDEPAPRKAKPVKRAVREDDEERPRKASGMKKRKAKPKSQLPLILGLAGGLVVLAGAAIGAYLAFGRSDKPERDDRADGRDPNGGRYRQDELFGPGENGGRPKATGPATRLSAEELYRAFPEGRDETASPYHEKLVEVTGTIKTNTADDNLGLPNIQLDANAGFLALVVCHFPESARTALKSYREGTTITIRGRSKRRSGNFVVVEDCVVVPGS